MLVIVTYDVNVSDAAGQKRLRKVAKLCERHGLRVQNSVFEVLADAAQLTKLKAELASVIDHQQDSVRFYRLGNSYKNRIDTMGRTGLIQTGEPLLLYTSLTPSFSIHNIPIDRRRVFGPFFDLNLFKNT